MENTANSEKTAKVGYGRPPKEHQFKPGQSGNPSGRPKGTLKDYVRRMFMEMEDSEKKKWLEDNNINPIDIWKMGEGNPKQDTEVKGNLTISEVLNQLDGQATSGQNVEDKPPLQNQEQNGQADSVQAEPSASGLPQQEVVSESNTEV